MSLDEPLSHTFTAPIEKDATYLTVPSSNDLLGTGRAVKVTVHDRRASLRRNADAVGPRWLPMKIALCKLVGKNQKDEMVTVHLKQRLS